MTIAQANRFYEQDTKAYEISKNEEFLTWLKQVITNGYHCFIDIDELQELIDYIANWYEIKYPERELKYYEGIEFIDFPDLKKISNVMNIRQLFYRLPQHQLCLMECEYRAKIGGTTSIYENGNVVGYKSETGLMINKKNRKESNSLVRKNNSFLLHADCMTGEVLKDYNIKQYIDTDEKINLEELLTIFDENYTDELDFTELKNCIYDHNIDLELRYRILQLVALKLIYSKKTVPERGYERAKRFINEFNKKLGLTLSMEEIDEITNRDYSSVKESDSLDKNDSHKEKTKGLITSIFRRN